MILERAKYEKPGVTQLMYVGDTEQARYETWLREDKPVWLVVLGAAALWFLLRKKA